MGEGSYYTVEISRNVTLRDLLTHLYVLVPVLDADKHYWVGKDEIEKLLSCPCVVSVCLDVW